MTTEPTADPRPCIVFGGSFSPFHRGHLGIARAAHRARPEALVLLLPAGSPPHKEASRLLPFAHRIAMLEAIAAAERAWLGSSDLEQRLAARGPTYTVDTMRAIAAKRPQCPRLSFIIGGDSLAQLGSWSRPEELCDESEILTIARPGSDSEAALRMLTPRLGAQRVAELRRGIILMQPSSISSTEIRHRLGAGRSISELVPAAVESYLRKHQLLSSLAH